MNRKHFFLPAIALCSVCASSPAITSNKPAPVSADEGRAFFDRYVAIAQTFAAELDRLYDTEARVRTVRHSAAGGKGLELTGAQWKSVIAQVLPLAKRAGDTAGLNAKLAVRLLMC